MFGQFKSPNFGRFSWHALAVGLTIFLLGLFKKTVLADNISPLADGLFAASMEGNAINLAADGAAPRLYDAALFRFLSGYSDMAIGLARCSGCGCR